MRVVLTGASGQLGDYLLERLLKEGFEVSAWSGSDLGTRSGVALRPVELTDVGLVERVLKEVDPAVIIHAGAIASVEVVRRDPSRGAEVNVAATGRLADWCARHGRQLVFTSTDMVFDGTKPWWKESDAPNPLSEYGRTKVRAEAIVREVPGALTIRLSLMYGPSRSVRPTFFDKTIAALRRGEPQTFFRDEFRTPIALWTAAEAIVSLVREQTFGVIHLGGSERLSRFEFAGKVANALGVDANLVRGNLQSEVPATEPRPADLSLDTTRLSEWLPDLKRPSVEVVLKEKLD